MFYTKIRLLIISVFLLGFTFCSIQENKSEVVLDRAEQLMIQSPDSALHLLEIEVHPKELSEEAFNKYILLSVQAKDKTHRSIADDTLVFKAKEYFEKTGKMDKAALASFYSGLILAEKNEKEAAMSAYLEAESYAKEHGDNTLKGLIEHCVGDLYLAQLMNEEAISRYKKAALYFKESGNYKNEIISFDKLGMSYFVNNQLDSSFFYYDKSLHLATVHKDSSEFVFILQNIGSAFSTSGNTIQARDYFKKSIGYATTNGQKAKLYFNIAYSFNKENNRDSTLSYLNKSLSLIQAEDEFSLKYGIYQLLSNIEENTGNYKEALIYHKEYTKELNKVIKKKNNQAILDVQKKYNFELVQNENNRLLIEKQSAFLIILILLVFILAMVIVFYWKNVKNKEALSDAEHKISNMKDLADSFNEKENSFRKVLLQHFDILKKVALIETHLREDEKKQGQRLLRKVNEIVYNEKSIDWDLIYLTMEQLYEGFPSALRSKYTQLDESEFRICCLAYAGLSNTEISVIMNFSVNTIQMKKSSVRKKLGIDGYGNIIDFLSKSLK